MKQSTSVSFDAALTTVLAHTPLLRTERVPLADAAGRVLSADIVSDIDMPPCDVSVMDGYACRACDCDKPLAVVETIAAGTLPRKTVGKGHCSRIMTGAPLPKGADTVVMFENTMSDDRTGLVTVTEHSGKTNIRRRAEDLKKGAIALRKGTLIRAAHVAVLASLGAVKVPVFRQPRVGVLATGDELVEPRQKPRPGRIRNSNGAQLCAQIRAAGCVPSYYGIVRDDPVALDRTIRKALAACDVVLLSGGVSMGDFDYVPQVLRKNGITLLFEKIAVKPGKPTVFGITGKKRLFGMPGNPVSTFVIFETIVKPFLYRMMGNTCTGITVRALLGCDLCRKKGSRMEFRPVRFAADGTVVLPAYHGSAHIHAYTQAEGIVALPAGVDKVAAGEMIAVRMVW
jgi:molybdopterin molybdotransferase